MKRFSFLAALALATISVPSMAEFTVAQAVGPPAHFAPYDDSSALTGTLGSVSVLQARCLGAAGLERAVSANYASMTATGLVIRSYARIERTYAVEVGGWPS